MCEIRSDTIESSMGRQCTNNTFPVLTKRSNGEDTMRLYKYLMVQRLHIVNSCDV